ncbi:MAG: hypothetical protein ACFB50_00340 [Rubrobacteraceae bacterium]
MIFVDVLQVPVLVSVHTGFVGLAGSFPALVLAQADYGFFGPVISALRAIGMGMAGVGLMIAILIKGSAATNADRHVMAAQVAERVFAGMFLILLGWFIYDKIVAWTPL